MINSNIPPMDSEQRVIVNHITHHGPGDTWKDFDFGILTAQVGPSLGFGEPRFGLKTHGEHDGIGVDEFMCAKCTVTGFGVQLFNS